jgi:hypothetical protein
LEVKFGGWVAVSAVGREKPTTAENDGCIPPNASLAGFFILMQIIRMPITDNMNTNIDIIKVVYE